MDDRYLALMPSTQHRLPADLSKRLTAELAAGERVLYSAQPDWRADWGKMLVIFLFGFFWSSISFLFFGMSLGGILGLVPVKSGSQQASAALLTFMFFFSLPFVAIGLAMLAAPFLGIRKSRNTAHAVTDARVINVYGGIDAGAESYPLKAVNFVRRRDRRDGRGSLEIGYGVEKDSDGDTRPLALDWSGIPDAKRAEALIRQYANWVR